MEVVGGWGSRLGVVLGDGGVGEATGLAAAVGGRVGLIPLVPLILTLPHGWGDAPDLRQRGGGHPLSQGRAATGLGERPAWKRINTQGSSSTLEIRINTSTATRI